MNPDLRDLLSDWAGYYEIPTSKMREVVGDGYSPQGSKTMSELNAAQLTVLRIIASGADALPPGLEPAAAAAALDWLLDTGYVTFNGAVGSVPVLTDTGRAYLKAHVDD